MSSTTKPRTATAKICYPNGEIKVLTKTTGSEDFFNLKWMQETVGGNIDSVPCDDLNCDDDGHPKDDDCENHWMLIVNDKGRVIQDGSGPENDTADQHYPITAEYYTSGGFRGPVICIQNWVLNCE